MLIVTAFLNNCSKFVFWLENINIYLLLEPYCLKLSQNNEIHISIGFSPDYLFVFKNIYIIRL